MSRPDNDTLIERARAAWQALEQLAPGQRRCLRVTSEGFVASCRFRTDLPGFMGTYTCDTPLATVVEDALCGWSEIEAARDAA